MYTSRGIISEVKATMNAWKNRQRTTVRKARKNTERMTGSQSRSGTHVCDDGENGHPVEDFLPGSDAVGLRCHRTPELSGQLPGVHPDLDHVVEERQERSQGEGGHKERDETKLDH